MSIETQAEQSRRRRRSPDERARARLEHLFHVSTLLTRFESLEGVIPSVLEAVSEALPLQTAVLLLESAEAPMHATVCAAEGTSPERQRRASARAARTYATLLGHDAPPELAGVETIVLPSQLPASDGQEQLVLLPLVVAGEEIFGALQVEGVAPLDELDLAFVNTVVNQLAVAVARHRAIAAREAAMEAARIDAERGRARAEQQEQRFQSLVDNLDHAFVWEAEGRELRLTYISGRATVLLGHEAWVGRELFEHIHPDDREAVAQMVRRTVREQRDRSVEHRMVGLDGKIWWFHTGVHQVDTAGGALRWQAVSVDVTPARRAAERVAEQLELTRAVTTSLGEGVLAVDRELEVTLMNPAAEAMLGLAAGAANGRPIDELLELTRADGAPLGRSPLTRAIQSGRLLRSDAHWLVRTGAAPLPVSYTSAPLRRNGEVTGAVLVLQDLLEARRAEQEQRFLADIGSLLGASLERRTTLSQLCRAAVPVLADLCFIDELDEAGHAVRIEVALADREKQPLAEHVRRFAPSPGWRTPEGEALRTGSSVLLADVDVEAIARDEDHASVLRAAGIRSLLVVPLTARGRTLGALTFCMAESGRRYGARDRILAEDVARRASMAIDNATLYEEARRATAARQELLAIVSHDLRNPLSAVTMATQILLEEPISGDEQRVAISRIGRAAERASHLVEDLLDLGSIESGTFTVERKAQPLAPILHEAVEAAAPTAEKRGLRLELEVAGGPLEVCCDRERVLQVLGNLIGNAMKFTPRGGRIGVRTEARGDEALIAVSDTGRGIPAEALSRIFERYWQVGRASRAGAGLGLAIAEGLVRAQGGRIWAASEEGAGSTFSFTLPLAQP